MGIPSYFSHIVRSHRSIIKKYSIKTTRIDNLYLDCNSIIYDSVRTINAVESNAKFEKDLIRIVCEKILFYINTLSPKKRVFIAFDGVAPVAKLEQQRNRRYKSWFEKQLYNKLSEKDTQTDNNWNTVSITPGTKFMENLGKGVRIYFKNSRKFSLEEIIVSPSDEPGEGEHKIYEYIRNNSQYHIRMVTTASVRFGCRSNYA